MISRQSYDTAKRSRAANWGRGDEPTYVSERLDERAWADEDTKSRAQGNRARGLGNLASSANVFGFFGLLCVSRDPSHGSRKGWTLIALEQPCTLNSYLS